MNILLFFLGVLGMISLVLIVSADPSNTMLALACAAGFVGVGFTTLFAATSIFDKPRGN